MPFGIRTCSRGTSEVGFRTWWTAGVTIGDFSACCHAGLRPSVPRRRQGNRRRGESVTRCWSRSSPGCCPLPSCTATCTWSSCGPSCCCWPATSRSATWTRVLGVTTMDCWRVVSRSRRRPVTTPGGHCWRHSSRFLGGHRQGRIGGRRRGRRSRRRSRPRCSSGGRPAAPASTWCGCLRSSPTTPRLRAGSVNTQKCVRSRG